MKRRCGGATLSRRPGQHSVDTARVPERVRGTCTFRPAHFISHIAPAARGRAASGPSQGGGGVGQTTPPPSTDIPSSSWVGVHQAETAHTLPQEGTATRPQTETGPCQVVPLMSSGSGWHVRFPHVRCLWSMRGRATQRCRRMWGPCRAPFRCNAAPVVPNLSRPERLGGCARRAPLRATDRTSRCLPGNVPDGLGQTSRHST